MAVLKEEADVVYIQEVVKWTGLNDETLSFYKAIGVDMIHLDIRTGVSTNNPTLSNLFGCV
jgi:hypothetical protein